MRVNRQVVGFKKIKFYTMENIGAGHLSMPEQEMHTTSFWLHFPEAFLARFPDLSPTERQNGLTGLGNALRTVAALLVMCDPRDLGVAMTEDIASGLRSFEPNLHLYDNLPGRRRPERAAVSSGRRADRARGGAARFLPLRVGLSGLRGTGGRNRRARQGSGAPHPGRVAPGRMKELVATQREPQRGADVPHPARIELSDAPPRLRWSHGQRCAGLSAGPLHPFLDADDHFRRYAADGGT